MTGLCEVSQQQNETQTMGQAMSLPAVPPVADHTQSGPGMAGTVNYSNVVTDASMTTVAASLGVPNNTVVSMATMTQPMGNQLGSPNSHQRPAPSYSSPSYRGRPRGRRPSGSSGGRGGWTGGGGEKRNAAAAGLQSGGGGVRRPSRGTYRGSWPNRSPSKTNSPTGSNQSTVQGSSSQGEKSKLMNWFESFQSQMILNELKCKFEFKIDRRPFLIESMM